tara:strand:+ start:1909 stop:2724 length:816 start_codon:yes stop_codon:yes gene_type:complete
MAEKKKAPSKRSSGKLKIRGGREMAKEIIEDKFECLTERPIKSLIKLNQLPWTEKQKEFFKLALDRKTKIIFVNGPAGTSKSLLSVYCGLQLLNMKVIDEIMYLRSAVESSASSLGFLPGNADEKLKFYNMPFIDKLEELLISTKTDKLMEDKRVSMFPVNFARGMNWKSKCIILDEAQNSTLKEITTVLTRMGECSRCFVLADPMQTDLKSDRLQGGFQDMLEIFSDKESKDNGVYTFNFTEEDIMRSELIRFLIKKINKAEKTRKDPNE